MKNSKLAALAALSLLVAAPAMAATPDAKTESSYEAKDNGGYVAKEKTESTDQAGTTVEHSTTKKLSVDNNGDTEKTVDIKSSTDPKGLMNKTSTEVRNVAKEKNGETKYSHKKIVNGKTVEDNSEEQKSQ